MNRKDILAPLIIGEICAIIVLLVMRATELPQSSVTNLLLRIIVFFPLLLPLLCLIGVFIASYIGRKAETLFQMAKSFLIGILNTLINIGALTLLKKTLNIETGWVYSILFVAIAFTAAAINSYLWNKLWTFDKKEKKEIRTEFSKFLIVTVGGFLIQIGITSITMNLIGPRLGFTVDLWGQVTAIMAAFASFLWNFFGYKLLVFKK